MASREPIFTLDSFVNVLILEKTKSFNNTSVFGGLDKYIERWQNQILATFSNSPSASNLFTRTYAQMTRSDRKKWIDQLLRISGNSKTTQGSTTSGSTTAPPNAKKDRYTLPSTGSKSPSSWPLNEHTVDSTVNQLRGVDAKTSSKLSKLGVTTIRNLLYLFPRRYNDYSHITKISDLKPDEEATIIASVWEAREIRMGRGGTLKATEAIVGDETGNIRVIWFGQPYLARQLQTGTKIALSGRSGFFNRRQVL